MQVENVLLCQDWKGALPCLDMAQEAPDTFGDTWGERHFT